MTVSGWQPIASAPHDEESTFLVRMPWREPGPFLVLQVTVFQGDMYPDHLGFNVAFDDRVTNATEWRPLP